MAFPSDDHFCYKANPAGPVNLEHQTGFCLTEQHAICPVFLAQTAAPLPAALASPRSRWPRARWAQRTPALLAVVLLLILAGFWISRSRSAARSMSADNPLAPAVTEGAVPFTGPDANPASSQPVDSRLPQTLSSGLEPGRLATRDCPLPLGWQTYTIQPTDSIYRLSIIYAVRVETLQKVNCRGNQTVLIPGETFFVPALNPTTTTTRPAIATPAPTRARSPFIGRFPTQEPSSDDEDEDPTPTAQPRAPVVVPPIFTPTQGVQPTNPPPTPTEEPVVVPTNPPPTQVVQPTAPPPPPTQVVQPTEPEPTKEPKPTKEDKPTKPAQPGINDNSGVD